MPGLDGLAVVDKPAGCTSHDVERRSGHAGTLDPDPTGVLLCGVGRVTRLLRSLPCSPSRLWGNGHWQLRDTPVSGGGPTGGPPTLELDFGEAGDTFLVW